jgi:hypothetical protein
MRKIYQRRQQDGQFYYAWTKDARSGYYNLDAMLALKGLTRTDVEIISAFRKKKETERNESDR